MKKMKEWKNPLIIILFGFLVGWIITDFIMDRNEKNIEEIKEAKETEVVEQDLIATIESILNLEGWSIEYRAWDDDSYKMKVDIGREAIYFNRRESLSDFFDDLDKLRVFQE